MLIYRIEFDALIYCMKRIREMYFVDDGFPLGVSYCLAVLKQVHTNEVL